MMQDPNMMDMNEQQQQQMMQEGQQQFMDPSQGYTQEQIEVSIRVK
jgi:hypothetical protein